MEVATVTIHPERIVLTAELPGRTSPYLVAEIRPQVNGLIQSRLFREGALVRDGPTAVPNRSGALTKRPITKQKPPSPRLKPISSRQRPIFPPLRSRAERFSGLVAVHAVGQQDYDDASAAQHEAEATIGSRKSTIEVNRAALEGARINLAYTPIKAPISGRIGMSNITVGALATAYQASPAGGCAAIRSDLRGCGPSQRRVIALATQFGERTPQTEWVASERGGAIARGRNDLPHKGHAAIPRRHGGSDHRFRSLSVWSLPTPRRSCFQACLCGQSWRRA